LTFNHEEDGKLMYYFLIREKGSFKNVVMGWEHGSSGKVPA
jgi:hypothetical protein